MFDWEIQYNITWKVREKFVSFPNYLLENSRYLKLFVKIQ